MNNPPSKPVAKLNPDCKLQQNEGMFPKSMLETAQGFLIGPSGKDYISHWECCKCNAITNITDSNRRWMKRHMGVGSPGTYGDYLAANDYRAKIQLPKPQTNEEFEASLEREICSRVDCDHERCENCWDIDVYKTRRQRCDGRICEIKPAKLWLDPREPYDHTPYENTYEKFSK